MLHFDICNDELTNTNPLLSLYESVFVNSL